MAAMMPAGGGGNAQSANPYDQDEDLIIENDDETLDDLDDPIRNNTSDRAPLVSGNISSQQANQNNQSAQNAQGFLNSAIAGEDRRAPMNTIDESVWETVRRDLISIWEKMRQVLYPKYLFGGMMNRNASAAEDGAANHSIQNIMSRFPDTDAVLQGSASEGLQDWDLWGPLLFCLLLSVFLSFHQGEQRQLVFSGVFATIWIGEAVVTLQIKLLGGSISFFQSVSIIGYTLFPMVIASLLSAINIPMIVRIPVYVVLGLWSLGSGVSILRGSGVVKNRLILAVYPLLVFYAGLSCLCFIS